MVQARPSQNPCALHLHICILQYYVWQQCGASLIFTESLCSASCVFAFYNTAFCNSVVQAWSSQNPSALHLRIRFTILRLATVWCKPSLHRVLRSTSCAYAFYNTAFCNSVVQARPSQNPCALCPAHMHFTILSLVKTRCKPDLHRILALCILRICILQYCVWQQCGASPAFTESLRSASCACEFYNTAFCNNAVQVQPSQILCDPRPAHMHFTILRLASVWCESSLHRILALCVLRMHVSQHCVLQQCSASPVFTESLRSASCAYAFHNTAFCNNAVQAWSSQNPCALRPAHTLSQYCVWQQRGASPAFTESLRSASCAYEFHNTVFCNSVVQAWSSQNPCALHPAHMHYIILSLAKTRCKPDLHRILALCILRICILQYCVLQHCGASLVFTDS